MCLIFQHLFSAGEGFPAWKSQASTPTEQFIEEQVITTLQETLTTDLLPSQHCDVFVE